jgi:hypothetical protein
MEWARNAAEIDHNLFDFSTTDDGGNLITDFSNSSTPASDGPTLFHDNLIKNPGRGLYNSNGHVYNNIRFYNNHVIANTTATPRTEGMFGLPTATTFSTIEIADNIFEFVGRSRGLFRNTASYAAVVSNNTLVNVSDAANYANPDTGAPRGPLEPLFFRVGAYGEYTVDQWEMYPTTDILAWWKLDDAAGAPLADASGNFYEGAAAGPTVVAGKLGSALSFDGSNDYAELPTGLVSTTAGSVAVWVSTTKNFTATGQVFYASAVTGGDGGGSQDELHVNFTSDERVQLFIEGGSADVSLTSPLAYADGLWHLVAATWDISGKAKLYVDGALVASAVHDAREFVCTARTRLGRPDTSSRYYTGLIDDVRLYDRVISPAEVTTLWNAGAGAPPPGLSTGPRPSPGGSSAAGSPPVAAGGSAGGAAQQRPVGAYVAPGHWPVWRASVLSLAQQPLARLVQSGLWRILVLLGRSR